MQLEARGIIFDAGGRPASERVNAFTSLCRLKSGTILAGFQSGPAKHAPTSTVRLCRSDDAGVTWRELGAPFQTTLGGVPGSLSSGDMLEVEPGRLLLFSTWFDRSDPAKPLFDPVTQGVLHCRQVWCESRDNGQTWSDWNVLPTPGLTGCASTGALLRWSDGSIGYAFESFKEFDDPNPGRHGAWLAISRDGGRTFPEFHLVAQHPEHQVYYWDQRLCPGKAPGEYYAMFWTHNLVEQRDLDVHFRHGQANSPAEPMRISSTGISGQISAPLLLDDGRLVAFIVDRNRPGTLKLWCSSDQGQTWPAADALTVHVHDERALLTQGAEHIDFNEYWDDMAKWTFGHPAVLSLGDGQLLLAFYAGAPGTLSMHWARVRV